MKKKNHPIINSYTPAARLLIACNIPGSACRFVQKYADILHKGEYLGPPGITLSAPAKMDPVRDFLAFLKGGLVNLDPEYNPALDNPYLTKEIYNHVFGLVLAGAQITDKELKKQGGHPRDNGLRLCFQAPPREMRVLIGGCYDVDNHMVQVLYGCFKRLAHFTRLLKEDPNNVSHKQALQDVCRHLVTIGSEEYYHSFQHSSPMLKKKLDEEFKANMDASTVEEARDKYWQEDVRLCGSLGTMSQEEIIKKREELRHKQPYEANWGEFSRSLVADNINATADYYLENSILKKNPAWPPGQSHRHHG